jgi:hypothetical protein
MNLGMKIFNKAMFDRFQGFADQGQVFKDDALYTLKHEWKFRNGETKPFLVTGKMIYQALNRSPGNDRFGDTGIHHKDFINQMILNLCV